ncbi:hypothetical protein IAD21_03326 [Abditibacteriota bacterium]|nr:hypothetical protein IAD21_03326 [Abditibacteriota bacterium]
MKRFLLTTLPLLISSAALAQPDPNGPGMGVNPPEAQIVPNPTTPENAVRKFVADLNGNLDIGLTADVVGARVGFYGTDDWEWAFNNMYPLYSVKNLKIDAINVENQTENEATVSLTFRQQRRNNEPTTATLQLHRNTEAPAPAFGFLKNIWQIVPPTTEDVIAASFAKTPPFQLAAALALRDPKLLPLIRQQRGLNQLKQLGLGAAQFLQDYDEFFAFDDVAHERALFPYLKDAKLFTITGTTSEKWHFNDNLSTLSSARVNEPARTVLFYDGEAPDNDKLNFRFGDKTLIGFVDGHCKAVSKDELGDLIWKP